MPDESLEEIMARAMKRYYARMCGSTTIWAVFDTERGWNAEPVTGGVRESEARDIADSMNAQSVLSALDARGYEIRKRDPDMIAIKEIETRRMGK